MPTKRPRWKATSPGRTRNIASRGSRTRARRLVQSQRSTSDRHMRPHGGPPPRLKSGATPSPHWSDSDGGNAQSQIPYYVTALLVSVSDLLQGQPRPVSQCDDDEVGGRNSVVLWVSTGPFYSYCGAAHTIEQRKFFLLVA